MTLMPRRGAILLVLVMAVLARPAAAGEWRLEDEHWYELLISDVKAGWMSVVVHDDGARYRTVTASTLRVERGSEPMEVRIETRFVETHDGEPVEVTAIRDMSDQEVLTHWRFEPEGIVQTTTQGGTTSTRSLPGPEGVWLTPVAADRYAERLRAAGAEEITYRTLDPEHGAKPMTVRSVRVGEETYEIDGRRVPVTAWRTTTDLLPVEARELFSRDGHLVYQEIPGGFGLMVTRIADREAAQRPREGPGPELMVNTFIRLDPPLTDVDGLRRARLRLRVREGALPALPSAAAQRVEPGEDGASAVLVVDVDDNLPALAGEADDPEHLEPSAMVNADDPLVRKLAERAVRRRGDDPRERAEAMRGLVFRHITRKGLQTAFASAAETARTRQGDCSEHAVLLCAMLRADGIPARVATGLVYLDRFGGERGVFGWHMWTQALIDGRWIDLDATQRGEYHAGHVLISTSSLADGGGNGELAALLMLIGNLEIEVLEE